MVALKLLPGSKLSAGRTWNSGQGPSWKEFQVYRWHPEEDGAPRIDRYWIDREDCGPMVLDALHKIRSNIDPTLSFRRSCREGICGSCSMNINGENGLACMTKIEEGGQAVRIFPLPHMRVIRDLVPDLSGFFAHYHTQAPFLQAADPIGGKEHLQSPAEREKLDGLYECILCACCSSACPSYWWNEQTFPGPAALLQANRWVQDSRDDEINQRLDAVETYQGVYGCRQILNCAKVCPKGLNPAQAISALRRLLMSRGWRTP